MKIQPDKGFIFQNIIFQRDHTSIEAQFEGLEISVGFADSPWGWWGRKVEDPLGRIHPLDTTS